MLNSHNMNKVLFIAYFFPPLSGPGTQRSYNFVRYLRENNWEPVVMTVKDICYVSRDERLLTDLKDIDIYRTETLDPMRFLYLWERFWKVNPQKSLYQKGSEEIRSQAREIFPIDSKLGWLPFAQNAAQKLCRIHDIKAIYVSMSPYSSGILAYNLHRQTGLPYVLDYRDLWQGKPDISYHTSWHKNLAVKWEKRIIKEAAAIIHVTRRSCLKFKEIYPQVDSNKLHVIFNGYDDQRIKKIKPFSRQGKKYNIVYAGHFYGGQSPARFIQAIKELQAAEQLSSELVFEFVGNYSSQVDKLFAGVKGIIRTGYLAYDDYLQKIADSDALLLFVADNASEFVLTQKIFDYLAVRRPILAMVPPFGEAAELIKERQAGIVTNGSNVSDIKKGIIKMQTILKAGRQEIEFSCQKNDYSIFSRQNQAIQLADIFRGTLDA